MESRKANSHQSTQVRRAIRPRRPSPHSLYEYDTYFAVHSPGMSELIVAVDLRDLDALCLNWFTFDTAEDQRVG